MVRQADRPRATRRVELAPDAPPRRPPGHRRIDGTLGTHRTWLRRVGAPAESRARFRGLGVTPAGNARRRLPLRTLRVRRGFTGFARLHAAPGVVSVGACHRAELAAPSDSPDDRGSATGAAGDAL